MTDAANFREINGIGPAFEAELHEAGVRTWSSLAAVLGALGHVKGIASDGLRDLRDEVRARASEADQASGPTLAEPKEGATPSESVADAPVPATAVEVADASDDAAAVSHESRTYTIPLDAGPFIGGHGHDVDLALVTDDVDSADLESAAELAARTFGDAAAPWVPLGRESGRCAPPEQPTLHFSDVDLAPGVYRTRLQLTVTLPEPTHTAPSISIA